MASRFADWQTVTLEELGRFRNGVNFSQDDYGAGIPIINVKQLYRGRFAAIQDILELRKGAVRNLESVKLKAGDILFARSSVKASGAGQVAMVGQCPANTVFSGFIIRYRVEALDRADPRFLNYVLRSPVYRELLTRIGSGTTITNLSQDTLRAVEVDLPPLLEQRTIAEILGALDDKIELNTRMNDTLEAMAIALFRSWVVNLDAERAKAANLVRDRVLEIGDGYRAKNSELGTKGLPFIRAGNLNNGFDTAGADRLCMESVGKAGSKVSCTGDVAFTSKGTIGRFARVTEQTDQFVYSPQICYWRSLDQSLLEPVILYCWMLSDDLREQIAAVAGQTDMAPYVSLKDQRQMTMPIFPPSQHAVANQIAPILARQSANVAEVKTLAGLRDALLPKLISGELRVKDAERFVEAAL
ncbi:MAG TPA: restriction endonuclease subunit S [Blastocatellia bacterium]|nr:restriction endonuclease subunit S [Blastocatellia bacterium]